MFDFKINPIHNDPVLEVEGKHYPVEVIFLRKKNSSAGLKEGKVVLRLSAYLNGQQKKEHLEKLLKKMKNYLKREQGKKVVLQNISRAELKKLAVEKQGEVGEKLKGLNRQYGLGELKQVKLKLMNSRWGSCSHRGNVSLNAKLLLMPPELLEYVALHELVHLKIKGHGPNFWQEVEKLVPDWKEKKKKLKRYK
ncbi:hypothetical protein COT40_00455 [Candidatus Peregrinibacteria bacterium CG08_land_8_20_14_0_20_41_10]|nr:MAG: hypothetical protein COT40_00455 [Candidatus Peregrinibacteria bacterium CG08_land_8_20_14_0_20_41_10]